MKIIDAHLHLFTPDERSNSMAEAVGHQNNIAYLQNLYGELNIVGGVVMGNQRLSPDAYRFPAPFRYCIAVGAKYQTPEEEKDAPLLAEEHLKRDGCAGIKLYAGYSSFTVNDPKLEPYYELAKKYGKPVAVHTGMTAGPRGGLKYSHPLTLDEAATRHRDVQFVMCHFGNPFLTEAAAVMEKNPNIAADLSGMLAGKVDLDWYFDRHAGYVQLLRTWLRYLNDDTRFMFGTDFPAVNYPNYIEYIRRLFEGESDTTMERVFFENANRIYQMGL